MLPDLTCLLFIDSVWDESEVDSPVLPSKQKHTMNKNKVGPDNSGKKLAFKDDVEMQKFVDMGIDLDCVENEEDKEEMMAKIRALPYPLKDKFMLR